MTEREAQTRSILRYLEEGNSITDIKARDLFGCCRLGARIYDLRRMGVPIVDEWEYKRDQSGKVVKKWKRYGIDRIARAEAAQKT